MQIPFIGTWLFKNLEEILASAAISVTVLVVIINVILRYGFGFVVPWSEELSVICFVWAVYLGISSCYKHKLHMGVDVIVAMLPEKVKPAFRLCVLTLLLGLNAIMTWLSFDYLMISTKSTPVMGLSYFYINSVLLLCFGMMFLHTVRFIAREVMEMRAIRNAKA
ncbi:TRAP transporter small permease [Endozoicomonas numazuensis]|uniref:TRAP transporter small permease protein n=1 Tax=Endozoicomonas numazuensis TaxID=1137799 RepID=A0A081NFS1_9GAMM|nr:TRAP transporter small permease [Endozoicomonas numazuensis]KEQ17294.1 C4-dicarboxylate ABC transporter permease [Endozoicomonas numazuensis]